MKPMNFNRSNKQLLSSNEDDVSGMEVYHWESTGEHLSKWKFESFWERLHAFVFGYVWVNVRTQGSMSPMWLWSIPEGKIFDDES